MHQCTYEWHVYRNDAEKATRYNIFKENVARIDAFNSQSGVNQFADLTNEELKASRNRFKQAICALHKQVLPDMKTFLQCQLQLIAERKELLPLSRAKAGVESTHPSENNTESLYIKTYFLTLFFLSSC